MRLDDHVRARARVSWLRNTVSGATRVTPDRIAALAQPLLDHGLRVGELRAIVDARAPPPRARRRRPAVVARRRGRARRRRSGSIRPWRCRCRSASRSVERAGRPRRAISPPLQGVMARSSSVASLCSRMASEPPPAIDEHGRSRSGRAASKPSTTTAAPSASGAAQPREASRARPAACRRRATTTSSAPRSMRRARRQHRVGRAEPLALHEDLGIGGTRRAPRRRRRRGPARRRRRSRVAPAARTAASTWPSMRAAGDLVQHLRPGRLHPRALARRQDDGEAAAAGRRSATLFRHRPSSIFVPATIPRLRRIRQCILAQRSHPPRRDGGI